jgi:acyl-CoA synthetase (AMP-forming)/AMP-acid ligase II
MILDKHTQENIYKAHFVKEVAPHDYLVKYKNFFDLLTHRLKEQPDNIFITFYPDDSPKIELTYKQFISKVFRTANLLRKHGINSGDRIATVSHNHINTVIQYFAAWTIGATVVPVNVSEEPERIKYILQSSHTKLAFVKHEYLVKITSLELPEIKYIYVHRSNGKQNSSDYPSFEEAIENESDDFHYIEAVTPEAEALIVYTSGTTGLPKGVVLTQYNLLADADGISKWHKIDNGQTMMCVLPIHHVNGTVVTLITPMYYGGKVILNQKFHTHLFFERIKIENVQIVSVVPTLLQFLCHDFEEGMISKPELTDFRHIICGAGPLTCELTIKFENIFGLKIMHGYGLSETTCYSCFLPVDLDDNEHRDWLNNFGFPSIGVQIETNEMDIHNEKGEPVNENFRGEIVIRGHNVMKYYDNNPDANKTTFEFGWFRSGDEGFYIYDDKGRKFFFITGRIKELIIRGGVNIAPLEIDEVLMSCPEVKSGIAVGFDNDWYGEEVGALVILKDEIKNKTDIDTIKQSIIKFCRTKLPPHKSPKVVIVSDTIPVTSTGKYQRNKVKHLFGNFKTIQFK